MQPTKTIFLYGLLFVSVNLFSQSPGGILKQTCWLKGNFSSETSLQRSLNFNPAMAMDNSGTGIVLPGNIESLGRSTIFTVYQHTPAVEEKPVWEMNGGFGDLSLSTQQVASNARKTNLVFTKMNPEAMKPAPDEPVRSETIIHTWLSFQGTAAPVENAGNHEAAIHFGNLHSGGKTNKAYGLISEFILYEKVLNEEEIAKVETYLAIKYGIALQKNYINATGEIVWNRENDALFSNHIAGIGRDDQSMLYQKQSTSSNMPGELVIGAGKIAESNQQNTDRLNDGDYLIWGDNAKSFTFEQNRETEGCTFILPEKKWLMKTAGMGSNKISTAMKIDIKTLQPGPFSNENFYLIIDRSGSGDFAPGHCEYFTPAIISADGVAVFSDVFWDIDASGKDIFTIGFKPTVFSGDLVKNRWMENTNASGHISSRLYPNLLTQGN